MDPRIDERKDPTIRGGWASPSSQLAVSVTVPIEGGGTMRIQLILDDLATRTLLAGGVESTQPIFAATGIGVSMLDKEINTLIRKEPQRQSS